jgi:two-component system, LuxR family, sensor kinase FixL
MKSVVLRTPAGAAPPHTLSMFSRETQAFMEAAVDAVIVIDHRGIMQAVNDATHRIFGYRTDELLGENVSMLMTGGDRDKHDEYMANYLRTGVANIIGRGRQVVARRKDGTLFPAHLAVGRIADSAPPRFVGLVSDTTAEQEAIDALKLERDRANAYLELHDSILLALDPERRVTEVNSRGGELLGAPVPDLIGRDWLDFADGDGERERARLMLGSALANGGSREREFHALTAAAEPRRIYWRCIARRAADGAPAGWLCSGLDTTDRALREEQTSLAQDRLTRVARLTTMGEMAAGIAHELNQPLTAITTYARACEHFLDMPQPDLAELRDAVREIGSEGVRAAKIIERLRQVVRGDGHDERVPTDINEVVEELRVLLTADARLYETRLHIALTPHLPRIEANPAHLQQVILTLTRNAFEALAESPSGERELTLTTLRTVNGNIEIRVSDNGPGVSPAISDRLFHPFSTTKKAGTGLGLAISRTIAQAHGGTISTRPVEPHGASFALWLPCKEEYVS